MKKHFWIGTLLCCLFLSPQNLFAVPAYPGDIQYKHPDGAILTIRMYGDEHFHQAETVDGYTIVFNDKGFYEYAVQDAQGNLVGSGIIAKDAAKRSSSDNAFLGRVKKKLTYSPNQTTLLRQISDIYRTERQRAFPTTGPRKLICILIGYTDLAFTKTKTDFEGLFNQVGYTVDGATGSVKDFYLENSWDQFTLDVTVAGPYTASNTKAYYGANDPYGNDIRPEALAAEAVNLADPDVDYTQFDNDGDGWVDGIYMIYAGYGEEAGGGADCIWAHAWGLASTVVLDGKSILRYSCSPELRGNSGTGITRIGVICHEFGHVLGAPDYYDTDYATGGQYSGTGSWDMMAGGSWNNSGATPAHHNGFTKWYYYNWFTPTALTTDQAVTIQNIEDNPSAYYFNSPTTNEYWFLENRQQTGFDGALPGHGMIIYHVDQDAVDARFYNNNINATHPQCMYPVCAGATGNPPDYGLINSAGCPYPGSSGATVFDGTSTPAAIDWAGNPSHAIRDIYENSGEITFNFQTSLNPGNFTAAQTIPGQIDLSWTLNSQNHNVLVAWSPDGAFGTPANGSVYTSGDAIPGGGTVLYYGTNTAYSHTGINTANAYYYKAWSYSGSTYTSGVTANYIPVLYSFDFETGALPAGWTETHGAATSGWMVGTNGSSAYWSIPPHTNYACVNDDACNCDMSDVWLISSALDFSTAEFANMTFDSYAWAGDYGGLFTIKASTDGGTSWTDISAIGEGGAWKQESVDLSSLIGKSNIKIAFHYNDQGLWGYGWAIDDIIIKGGGIATTDDGGGDDDGEAAKGFLPAIYLLLND